MTQAVGLIGNSFSLLPQEIFDKILEECEFQDYYLLSSAWFEIALSNLKRKSTVFLKQFNLPAIDQCQSLQNIRTAVILAVKVASSAQKGLMAQTLHSAPRELRDTVIIADMLYEIDHPEHIPAESRTSHYKSIAELLLKKNYPVDAVKAADHIPLADQRSTVLASIIKNYLSKNNVFAAKTLLPLIPYDPIRAVAHEEINSFVKRSSVC